MVYLTVGRAWRRLTAEPQNFFEKKNVNIIVIPQIFTNFALGLWKRPGDMHVPGPPKGEG